MTQTVKNTILFGIIAMMIIYTGFAQSWNSALLIIAMGLISSIMALGVNLQWGFAGLFNVGVMGFVALGGLAAVLVSMPPTEGAWSTGGFAILGALALGAGTVVAAVMLMKRMAPGTARTLAVIAVLVVGFFIFRALLDPAVEAVEAINPAQTGYLGGLGLPVLISWPVGGLFAAGAAWLIGKTALGLRSDYLAIATLGIAEIIIAVLKNEDWMSRGVKNVIGLPRPVPYEIDLQNSTSFVERAAGFGFDPAEAMGKDVTARHLQVFILGSAICGIAGAMMTTMDSQLTPGTYQPLRFTFLIWVMVIVGGSGNNFGAILGGFLIWFLWVQVEPMGLWLMSLITAGMSEGSALKAHLIESAAHMRLLTMGVVLLLVLRFSPRGLIPER